MTLISAKEAVFRVLTVLTSQPAEIVLIAVVALVVLGCVLVFPPKWLAPDLSDKSLQGIRNVKDRIALQSDRRKLQNDVRTGLAQALGGAALIAGLVFTWVQLQDNRAQLATQQDLTRRGQIAERFTRAVDQLANTGNLDVRLGGVYGLEQVARDAHDDRTRLAVYEVLTAYIRRHAAWDQNSPQVAINYPLAGGDAYYPSNELQSRAPDVQAVMTVLGRRDISTDDPHLDLQSVDLRNANLFHAHLEGASLGGAHLEGAFLPGAHLEGAFLTFLEGATLVDAHLERARLNLAYLERADLFGAHLERAELVDAHLERATLVDAHLERADLFRAHLEGATLVDAHLEGATLVDAHLERARLNDAHLEGANLAQAYLRGAYANAATVWPDGFDWRAAGVLAGGN